MLVYSRTKEKYQFDKGIQNKKYHTTVMDQHYSWACYSFLILFCFLACSDSNYTEFSEPFELSSFLKNHIYKLPGHTVQFQILDSDGEPIPYDLLCFEWVEGGRMSFQTDQDGTLSMQFENDMLDNEVIVSTNSERTTIRVVW